jgi:hypothetical protein
MRHVEEQAGVHGCTILKGMTRAKTDVLWTIAAGVARSFRIIDMPPAGCPARAAANKRVAIVEELDVLTLLLASGDRGRRIVSRQRLECTLKIEGSYEHESSSCNEDRSTNGADEDR